MAFFEPLRRALGDYAAGVHEARPPASAAALQALEARLGPLPATYRDLLRSFDGVSLFHELITLFGTVDEGLGRPAPGQLRVGEGPDGALWMDEAGALRLVDEGEPDPILCGSGLEPWLKATLGREGLVIDKDGEFRDALDDEGALTDAARWKRAKLGRRSDPGAAIYLLEEAELLVGERRSDEALGRLQEAVALDPQAGPAWELLGALRREAGDLAAAEQAALRAAAATPDPWLRASRLLDAALAVPRGADGDPRRLAHAAAAAQADPGHGERLLREAREALQAGQAEEAEGLGARLELLQAARPDAAALGEPLEALRRELRTRQALRVL